MLYVLQTETLKEMDTVTEIKKLVRKDLYNEVFTIRYENILRREGVYHINTKVLFPSYIFVETDNPSSLFLELKKVINLSIILSDRDEKGLNFFTVSEEEDALLRKLINKNEDYIVTLSIVNFNHKNRINNAAGPVKSFLNRISEVDKRHKRAFVEMEFLGRPRRLVFGFITKGDGVSYEGRYRLEEELYDYNNVQNSTNSSALGTSKHSFADTYENKAKDYNLKEIEVGDMVIIRTGLYGDEPYIVTGINGKKNIVTIEVEMFGRTQNVEINGLDVEKVLK